MPEIIKTEAIVLSKMDFGDSSKIATFFTKDLGKISAIIKGARTSKSRIGKIVDVLNHIQIVLYTKSTREIQLLSQADLISNYTKIKSDLKKLKYASAVLELLYSLTPAGEVNERLFKGVVKIFSMMESGKEQPGILLLKFILFLLKEIGFELQIFECSFCEKELNKPQKINFNFERGIMCEDCSKDQLVSVTISQELFNLFLCLRNKNIQSIFEEKQIENALFFIEKYLKFHIQEFKGINSIHLF
ncbi:MAG: DNA repair protein RecO [Ignavibacteriales bacterium]|nr:DNA repair protein RecO [Ignavibacteriales bacterium]